MTKPTVVTITGIRPDFIRMSEIFRKLDERFNHVLIHSGQHFDELLSDVFFKGLSLRTPDFNLGIGGQGRHHYHQLADISVKCIDLFNWTNIKPDLVMFLGDSNSCLASIALRKEGYRIAHIEAGMRSYDLRMLEEHNRKICDHLSDFLFVYHENYKRNLLKENVDADKIHVVGNTIVEVAKKWCEKIGKVEKKHILVDIHRPENFLDEKRLRWIAGFAAECTKRFNLPVKWLSFPRAMQIAKKFNIDMGPIQIIPVMGYIEFLRAQAESYFVLSDSGTAQEETALLGVPAIVPRDFTERWESVEAGNSMMLKVEGSIPQRLEETAKFVKEFPAQPDVAWLGDGSTSEKIIQTLEKSL